MGHSPVVVSARRGPGSCWSTTGEGGGRYRWGRRWPEQDGTYHRREPPALRVSGRGTGRTSVLGGLDLDVLDLGLPGAHDVLAAGVLHGRPDEPGRREDEQHDGGPHVEPQPHDVVHLHVVDAEV